MKKVKKSVKLKWSKHYTPHELSLNDKDLIGATSQGENHTGNTLDKDLKK